LQQPLREGLVLVGLKRPHQGKGLRQRLHGHSWAQRVATQAWGAPRCSCCAAAWLAGICGAGRLGQAVVLVPLEPEPKRSPNLVNENCTYPGAMLHSWAPRPKESHLQEEKV
jgi:hypothetical protein